MSTDLSPNKRKQQQKAPRSSRARTITAGKKNILVSTLKKISLDSTSSSSNSSNESHSDPSTSRVKGRERVNLMNEQRKIQSQTNLLKLGISQPIIRRGGKDEVELVAVPNIRAGSVDFTDSNNRPNVSPTSNLTFGFMSALCDDGGHSLDEVYNHLILNVIFIFLSTHIMLLERNKSCV